MSSTSEDFAENKRHLTKGKDQQEVTIIKDVPGVPKVKDSEKIPKVKQEIPKAKQEIPKVKQEIPKVKQEIPKVRHPEKVPKKAKIETGSCSKSPDDQEDDSRFWDDDLSLRIVNCSACGKQVNHYDHHYIKKHPHLGVIVCKECANFYGNGEFSQDEDLDKYCRWCAQGGYVFGCDFCSNVFCKGCIRRNFGRGEIKNVEAADWKCYVCLPSKLEKKVEFCNKVLKFSKSRSVDVAKKGTLENGIGNDPTDWLPVALQNALLASQRLSGKLKKLQQYLSLGKSKKQIVNKFEFSLNNHRIDMKSILLSTQEKYSTYVREQLSRPAGNNSKDSDVLCMADNSNKNDISITSLPPDEPESSLIDMTLDESCIQEVDPTTSPNGIQNGAPPSESGEDATKEEEKPLAVPAESSKISNLDSDVIVLTIDENSCPSQSIICVPETPTKSTSNENAEQDVQEQSSSMAETQSAKASVFQISDDEVSGISDAPTIPNDSDTEEKKSPSRLPKQEPLSSPHNDDTDTDALSSDTSVTTKRKKTRRIGKKRKMKKAFQSLREGLEYYDFSNKEDFMDDPKLNHRSQVVVQKLEMHDAEEEDSDSQSAMKELEQLKKDIKALERMPTVSKKASPRDGEDSKEQTKKTSTPTVKKKARKSSESSLFTLSSSDDEDKDSKDNFKLKISTDPEKGAPLLSNNARKDSRMSSSSSSSPLSSQDEKEESDFEIKKKIRKTDDGSAERVVIQIDDSDESDDFTTRKKPLKSDKLLKVPLDNKSDKPKAKGEKSGSADKKKSKKRKLIFSDDSDEHSNSSSDSDSSNGTSESSSKKKSKAKKRKRVKMADDSTDEKKSDDEEINNSQSKGRKNIRKLISNRKLADATKEAQEIEKERRRRIGDRQKLYNKVSDPSQDGTTEITRKMVLEVDQSSKEEIVEIHPDLVEKLKPHQVNGVKFMWESTIETVKDLDKPGSGCILAHCMGLGKTLQVIAFLHTVLTNKIVNKTIKTALILCPYNTVLNWVAEFGKWLEDVDEEVNVFELNVVKNSYDRRDYLKQWQDEGGVMIMGYNIFSRLVSGNITNASKKLKGCIYENICNPGADIVICDEGHMLKNENSSLSKSACKLKTLRRVILTGTPLQNNLKEYHCMMHFVKPNLLGTLREFTNRFVNPIENGQYDDSKTRDVKLMKKRVHILHKLLEGCVQRCDYSALTKFLPPKHEFVISVQLSEVQDKMYKYFLETFSQGKAEKVDGGKLFSDYNALKNIWTYPWMMYWDFERKEVRKWMQDDDEDMDSFIADDSDSAKSSEDSDVACVDDLDAAGPSKKKRESSDEDEVVRTYKTRSRRKEEGDESESEEETNDKRHWWSEYVSQKDDKFTTEFSGKMVLVMEILKECQSIGDKVLIFSQSILTLNMLEEVLHHLSDQREEDLDGTITIDDVYETWIRDIDYFRMDGSTNVDMRKRYIDMFNDPDNDRARLFLISTKAGSLGTNLIGANRVILLDASWNPSHDVQAIFRVYRFGQKKPVYIYRLLALGTMEEKIYNRQVTKLSLSRRVVDEKQIDRHFNAADLSELYKYETPTDRPTPSIPNDRLFADVLIRNPQWIFKYHEHDSLLQCSTEDDLTEEERQAAWKEYEDEKEGRYEYQQQTDTPNLGSIIVQVDNIVNTLVRNIEAKNLQLPKLQVYYLIMQELKKIHNMYQRQHSQSLRIKKDYVARGQPVPQLINNEQAMYEKAMERISAHILKYNLAQKNLQKQTFQPPPPQQRSTATFGNMFQQCFAAGDPRNFMFVGPNFPNTNAATFNRRAAATIIDITSDKESLDATSTSDAVPIVDEADEPTPEADERQKQQASNSRRGLLITEIE